jgi:3-keto-disaccharide hydrolase
MRRLVLLLFVVSAAVAQPADVSTRFFTSTFAAHAVSASTEVAFDSDRWIIDDEKAKKEEFLGRKSLFLSGGGLAYLKDAEFADGTIEVDIASMPTAFPGITFRFSSKDAHELVYLRPHHSGHDDATQYVPAFQGSHPWQIYNGKGYTAAANIPAGEWIHMRIEVKGLVARVWLGDTAEPTLVITDLKRGFSKGSVGITAGAQGAHFANFSYVTNSPDANKTLPAYPAPAPGTLTNWELSESFSTEIMSAERPPSAAALAAMKWEKVATEDPGMVVIDRYRRSPSFVPPFAFDRSVRLKPSKETKIVFARTVINSDRDQIVRMGFGYSDEVTVFLNRLPLFNGKSAWRFRDQDFNGVMDVEDDAVYLPLKKGRNELVLAVKEYFGGWGFICRLDGATGVKID